MKAICPWVIIKALRMNELSQGWREEKSHPWTETQYFSHKQLKAMEGKEMKPNNKSPFCEFTQWVHWVLSVQGQRQCLPQPRVFQGPAEFWEVPGDPDCGPRRPASSWWRDRFWVSNILPTEGHLASQISSLMSFLEICNPNFCLPSKNHRVWNPLTECICRCLQLTALVCRTMFLF